MNDDDLLKIVEQQVKENLKTYFTQKNGCCASLKKSKDFMKQLGILSSIIDEFLDVNNIDYICQRGNNSEFLLARYLKLS